MISRFWVYDKGLAGIGIHMLISYFLLLLFCVFSLLLVWSTYGLNLGLFIYMKFNEACISILCSK